MRRVEAFYVLAIVPADDCGAIARVQQKAKRVAMALKGNIKANENIRGVTQRRRFGLVLRTRKE
jgi:hypothetical protein